MEDVAGLIKDEKKLYNIFFHCTRFFSKQNLLSQKAIKFSQGT